MEPSESPPLDMQSDKNWSVEDHKVLVAVDIALFTIRDSKFQVLLIKRGIPPFLDFWALPGGLVRMDIGLRGEEPEEAALRELREETGLSKGLGYLEQLGTYGSPNRDPREQRVISIAYFGIGPNLEDPIGDSDASHATFMPVDQIAAEISSQLAFDHNEILFDAIERARAKLEYSTLATKFCSPAFTISELRSVYETIWGANLDPGNFQKKVLAADGFLEDTGQKAEASATGGRPAKLYRAGTASSITPPIRRN
ncbi:MAG: NUDIX domain-containing protein [Acidimicrobiales bacterium]|nr:NUDIX domain-containing protein [Acidimicrobiales bacterium]